jgi:Flp pilus assembly protein TadD
MIRYVLILLCSLAAAPIVAAQPAHEPTIRERIDAMSLDDLFVALHAAKSERSAKVYETEIQKRFHASGSDTADLLLSWAVEAMNGDDNTLAMDVLDQLVLLKPDFAEAWNKRATAEFLEKDYGASLSDIRRALALEPRHFGALSGLGIILEDLGREEEAMDAYKRALALNPQMKSVRESLDKLEKKADGRAI